MILPTIAATAVEGIGNYIGQSATLKKNKELADYQYELDKKMWDAQNEYNKPINQMARYQEAGLNKNLIYGQGTSGNADTAPKYSAPVADYTLPKINPLEKWIALRGQNQQIEMNDKIQQNYDANMIKTAAETARIMDDINSWRPAHLTALEYKNRLTEQQTKSTWWERKKSYDLFPYQYDAAKYGVDKLKAEIQNSLSDLLTKGKQREIMEKERLIKGQEVFDKKLGLDSSGFMGTGVSFKTFLKMKLNNMMYDKTKK